MTLEASQLRKVTLTFWGWCSLLAIAVLLHFSDTGVNHDSCKAIDCQHEQTNATCIAVIVGNQSACEWDTSTLLERLGSAQKCKLACGHKVEYVEGVEVIIKGLEHFGDHQQGVRSVPKRLEVDEQQLLQTT